MKNKKLRKLENLYHLYGKVSTVCHHVLRHGSNNVVLIGITGGVAAGKSTLGKYLQRYIKTILPWRITETISTDSFLWPNHYLKKYNLMQRKGFPETYDWESLKDFILSIKSRQQTYVDIPIYSQQEKDILAKERKKVKQADIYILEGVNVAFKYEDFDLCQQLDLSVYLDTNLDLAKSRAYARFYQAYAQAKIQKAPYFNVLRHCSRQQLDKYVDHLWQDINVKLLKQYIMLQKENAKVVIDSLPDFQSINVSLSMIA